MKIDFDYAETRDLYRAVRTHRIQIRAKDYGGEYIRRIEAIEERLHYHLDAIERSTQRTEPRALVPEGALHAIELKDLPTNGVGRPPLAD